MLAMIIALLIIFAIAWACFWLIDRTGVPNPFNVIAKVIIAIIAIVAMLEKAGLISSGLL